MKPIDLFPNMSSDGTAITIPISDLLQEDLSTGQALALNLVTTMWQRWQSNSQARVTRSIPIGRAVDSVRLNYTFSFDVVLDSTIVQTAPEPITIPPVTGGIGQLSGQQLGNTNQLTNG